MKKLFFLLLILPACVSAQKYLSPVKANDDSTMQAAKMKAFAQLMLHDYQNNDSGRLYTSRAYYALAAEDYKAFRPLTIKAAYYSFGDTLTTVAWMTPHKLYADIMLADHRDILTAYSDATNRAYEGMTDDNKSWFAEYYDYFSPELANAEWKKQADLAMAGDSVSSQTADVLLKAYVYKLVYERTYLAGKKFFEQKIAERYIIEDSIAVTRPGGILIPLTIVRPRNVTGKLPIVLRYNIYAGNDIASGREAADHGYIGITANTRGKRFSPQETEPMEHDAEDAYDIIDWISKQPWCNGKIGMFGGSYLGFAQWAALKKPHPALKTIVPQVSVGAGIDVPYFNGVMMNYMLRWLHYTTDNKTTANDYFRDMKGWTKIVQNWYHSGKSYRALDSVEGRPNKIFQRWLDHPLYDDYWKKMTPQGDEFARINIPIFTTTGYWDDDQLGAQWYYRQYMTYNKNPNYYLLIGPWDHGGSQYYPRRNLAGYRIDSVADFAIIEVVYKWFDHVLKDSSRPAVLKDRVNFQMPGLNRWLNLPSLDRMTTDTLRFFPTSIPENKNYTLSTIPARTSILQTVDLGERDTPHLEDDDITGFGSIITDSVSPGSDKLMFVSKPFEKETLLSGQFTADLHFTINKKDADFIMYFYEQMPDGKYYGITYTIQRASLAENRSKRNLLTPGIPQRVGINNTFITARKFSKGSRLVVILGINKSDAWQINYGTGKDVSSETIADAKEKIKITWLPETVVKMPVLRL